MLKEFKQYLKNYRASAKNFTKFFHHQPDLTPVKISFETDFSQYMCGYYYGLITYHSPLDFYALGSLYGDVSLLHLLVIHQPYQSYANQFVKDIDSGFEFSSLSVDLQTYIQDLNLVEFVNQANGLFNQIMFQINQTQTTPFDPLTLYHNIVTWTLYLLINDKLANDEISDTDLVYQWTTYLTYLTSLLTQQLKDLLRSHFEYLLEYISDIVLTLS